MLAEKYLPQFHHRSQHSILIRATPPKILAAADQLDLHDSAIIRFLFMLRGMPSHTLDRKGLESEKFITLEITDHELIMGIIGQFWKAKGNLLTFKPEEFVPFNDRGFAKGIWHFQITPQSDTNFRLTTETRILCTDDASRKKFSRYWFVIRPFSGLIRSQILKLIKKKAENVG